jgi:hypothetical protein
MVINAKNPILLNIVPRDMLEWSDYLTIYRFAAGASPALIFTILGSGNFFTTKE